MEKVNRFIEDGLPIPAAIKAALLTLGLNVAAFAEKHDLPVKAVSNQLNGNVKASPTLVAALAEELGGSPDGWREKLWLAAKPEPTAVATAVAA